MNIKFHHTLKELHKLYRTELNSRLSRRIHGLYLARKGLTCLQIIEVTGSARRTIQQWVRHYNAGGIEALTDAPRPGQPTKLARKKTAAFCKRIEAGPTKKDGVSAFNGPVITRILHKEFNAKYSLWGTYHLLHRLGFSSLCPRPQHEKVDPELQEAFKKTSSRHWIRSNQSILAKK